MRLTNAAVKAARPKSCAYKVSDGRGLHLYVAPTGTRSFRMRYRFAKREKLLTFGCYPKVQLAEARRMAEDARALIAQGVDPALQSRRAAAMQICTFEALARQWHAHQRDRWTDRHAADVIDSLARDVFPVIGDAPAATITAPAILALLRDIEARGCIETARRIRQRISAVFAFAIAEGLASADPSAYVGRALRPAPMVRRQPALTDLDEARALLAACEATGAPAMVRLASRFLALTAVRMGALIGARWDEIEDLDGPAPLWRVPAARMKLKKARKADAANDHIVPLSAAAVAVLHAAREIDAVGDVIFSIAPAAIGALYKRAGYGGRHVPHGWRATFSTILNEQFPQDSRVIEMALAHAVKGVSESEAAYNRAGMLEQRRDLFERWGAMLTA